jgi:hypothetical protein
LVFSLGSKRNWKLPRATHGRNTTIADFPAAAEFVCFKKFGRENNAKSVALAERAVDAHSQREHGR